MRALRTTPDLDLSFKGVMMRTMSKGICFMSIKQWKRLRPEERKKVSEIFSVDIYNDIVEVINEKVWKERIAASRSGP